MALMPDQERRWAAELERMGVSLVKLELERDKISPAYVHFTASWLSAKEREVEERKEASNSEQIALARRASEAAERAADAAARQATAAERANTRATIALTIAIISMIVTVIGIWITHMDVHK